MQKKKNIFFSIYIEIMKKDFLPISLFLTSILVGFFVIQFFSKHNIQSEDKSLFAQIENLENYENILVTLRKEQTLLQEKITKLREDISVIQNRFSNQNQGEYLEELHSELGLKEIQDPGIIIKLNDSNLTEFADLPSYDALLVHAADLRDLIQRLWTGGAEAIAINGSRITALTPITCVGNSILINDARMIPPFEILVIGDAEILKQELDLERYLPSIYARVQKQELDFSIQDLKNVTIPVFDGTISSENIKLIQDD